MGAIQGLLAILLVVAGMAFIFGEPGAAGSVMRSPFRLFGWMLRRILVAAGRGFRRIITDAHNYCYNRWPGWTLAFYGVCVLVLFIIGLFAR